MAGGIESIFSAGSGSPSGGLMRATALTANPQGTFSVLVQIDGADSTVTAFCDDATFVRVGDRLVVAKVQSQVYVIKNLNISSLAKPTIITDWNTVDRPGYYYGASATNGPHASTLTAYVIGDPNNNNDLSLVATRMVSSDNPEMWFRQRRGDTAAWNEWNQVVMVPRIDTQPQALAGSFSVSVAPAQASHDVAFPAGYFSANPVVTASASNYAHLAVGTTLSPTVCRIYYKSDDTNTTTQTITWQAIPAYLGT